MNAILNKTTTGLTILSHRGKKFLMSCLYDIEHALSVVDTTKIVDQTENEEKIYDRNNYLLDKYNQFKSQRNELETGKY